jgi:hypothetical protein
MTATHLAFALSRASIRDRILIPKYYDPDLDVAFDLARERYDLVSLGDILLPGESGSRLGDWIRRDLYGSGTIPFVRTSDLSHWRIRPDYKKGVSEAVYAKLKDRQGVGPGDILMVAHGTYLIGAVAVVTEEEPKLVLQDHVFRLRVNPTTGVDALYLLAALSTRFVRTQIRARQFSADIIDKIGNRHLEVRVPIPKVLSEQVAVSESVRSILDDQSLARQRIAAVRGVNLRMTRERATARHGFTVSRPSINGRILIPKYYDPAVREELAEAEGADRNEWLSIADLVRAGELEVATGIEVGKMAYGTGTVPFIRTSDIAELEVKRDIRHAVSQSIYDGAAEKGTLRPLDILVVRDGTYLVGSSAICVEADLPALYCGGMFRLRLGANSSINPFGLLASLNLAVVRRQMRARQFTRDVIDTLGRRFLEVRIPNPLSDHARELAGDIEEIMQLKQAAKHRIGELINSIEPPAPAILVGRPSWSMR